MLQMLLKYSNVHLDGKKACMCVRGRESSVCECGHVSIITEINSSPLFPLSPWVSAHTAAALGIWNSAKDTCGSTMCSLNLCTTVSKRAQQCVKIVFVLDKDLQNSPLSLQLSREAKGKEWKRMIVGHDLWFWLWNGRWWCGELSRCGFIMYVTINTSVIWENRYHYTHMLGNTSIVIIWSYCIIFQNSVFKIRFQAKLVIIVYTFHKCIARLTFSGVPEGPVTSTHCTACTFFFAKSGWLCCTVKKYIALRICNIYAQTEITNILKLDFDIGTLLSAGYQVRWMPFMVL